MAQHLIGTPIFRQFHNTSRQIATILFQLRFKTGKKRESVGCRAGKTGYDLAVVEPPQLAGSAFQYFASHGDLPVTRHHDFTVAAHTKDGGGTDSSLHFQLSISFQHSGPAVNGYATRHNTLSIKRVGPSHAATA